MKHSVLSICIPIYNRKDFLVRQFEQCMKCKDLFKEKVHLYISDNCSSQNLAAVAEEYRQKGLIFEFDRNEENIGPDANFIKCFNNAKGEYTWLLGSDDIPVDGFISDLVGILEKGNLEYLFLNHLNDDGNVVEYESSSDVLEKVHVWITFMSANIIRTRHIKNVNGNEYMNTNLVQVPYFLEGIVSEGTKAIYNCSWKQIDGDDSANNGGYNFFKVFVANLLDIVGEKVESNQMTIGCYERFKKSIFCNFILDFVVAILIKRDKKKIASFQPDRAWHILLKYYGREQYFYGNLAKVFMSGVRHRLAK